VVINIFQEHNASILTAEGLNNYKMPNNILYCETACNFAYLSNMTWPVGAVMFHVQFASSEYFPMKLGVSMMPGLVTCPPQPGNTALSIQTEKRFGTEKQLEFNMSTVRVM
jgi:hypothetical protein